MHARPLCCGRPVFEKGQEGPLCIGVCVLERPGYVQDRYDYNITGYIRVYKMALTPSQRLEALLDLCEAQPRSDLLGAEELWDPPNLCNNLKPRSAARVLGPIAHHYSTIRDGSTQVVLFRSLLAPITTITLFYRLKTGRNELVN